MNKWKTGSCGNTFNMTSIRKFQRQGKPIFPWQKQKTYISEKEMNEIKKESNKPFKQKPLSEKDKLWLSVLPENYKWRK